MKKTWWAVSLMIILMGALYCSLVFTIWSATDGMKNAIDENPGLPLAYDIILGMSMILIIAACISCIKIIRGWIPPEVKEEKKKSRWDSKVPDVSKKPSELPKGAFRSVRSDS